MVVPVEVGGRTGERAFDVHVYLLCWNEISILEHALAHYRSRLPSAAITVVDNNSTDGSAERARELGATVQSFRSSSRNANDE